ncbi:MAG: hypothetical protein JWQ89_2136 [Devosia sp.]|uniref:GyrI-like domain-containing protein n=1 Tax=Devosia sp. TaxID=1871048 RepID=UPI002635A3B0|nr:GyrI-like domain-containing protein [Devosia sp.]MDB5540409.1 hypothetical protein [Devosia sp.]
MLSTEVQAIDRPEKQLVGYRIRATLSEIIKSKVVHQLRVELAARAGEISHKTEDGIFLVQVYDGPGWTHDTPFTQIIGKQVDRVEAVPTGMINHTIPSGHFLRFEHLGPESEFAGTYDAINVWMRDHQREQCAPFDFEYWADIAKLDRPDSTVGIHLPIRRKDA